MRTLLILGAIVIAAVVTSCVSSPHSQHQAELSSAMDEARVMGLRTLNSRELRRLLVGHSVSPAPGSGLTTQHIEFFLPNGQFKIFGHRNTAQSGAYSFQLNAVCFRIDNGPAMCSIFMVDRHGNYFRKGIGRTYGPPEAVVIDESKF